MNLDTLHERQIQLAQQVQIPMAHQGYLPQEQDLVFSLDIQYEEDWGFVGVDVRRYSGELVAAFVGKVAVEMPYIPQYFCFREAPLLLEVLQKIQQQHQLAPDLCIIDGHGIAHPRRFGVASYVGINLEKPTIGCAKRALLPYSGTLGEERGASLPILLENQTVGKVLRTQDGINPVFVSSGHLIALEKAVASILHFSPQYRICEPLRLADHIARRAAKSEEPENVIFL